MSKMSAERSVTKSALLVKTSKDGTQHLIDLATHVIRRTAKLGKGESSKSADKASRLL